LSSAFEFEKPIEEVENQLEEVRARADDGDKDASAEIIELEAKLEETRKEVYSSLKPWDRVQIARHAERPRALDYIERITTDFVELFGDRGVKDDKAVICGFARLDGTPIAVIGQQKGRDVKENVKRNFGMMHPEGYRKALRIMRLAEKFKFPILIFIDTPGAYPGLEAEERGQAEAIARNIQEMFGLKVPTIAVVIGEGASGGALGIGLTDRVLMMENAWYCVISPEGCASIVWKSADKKELAAEALKLSAPDVLELKVIDSIVPEPVGGAHRDKDASAELLKTAVKEQLAELQKLSSKKLLEARFEKYRNMGTFIEG